MKKDIGDKKILAYALKNALDHAGKTSEKFVLSSLFHEGLKKSDIKKIMPALKKIIKEVNSLSLKEQEKKFEILVNIVDQRTQREGLSDLPGAKEGKVIMRFAPSPSGPMHIGHALTSSISFLYVQKYGGTFYVRIEDTNPENIDPLAYKMIKQESKWLFKNKAKIIIQSERMSVYYKYLEKLIKTNSAYICTCNPEKFRKFVKSKKSCPCRGLPKKQHLERWNKMLSPSKEAFKEGEAVARFKSDMKHKNPAMRDFPLARVNLTPHALQKTKYRVWPLMNLAVSVDDLELKMTHIIRAKEHRDNAKRQEMIFKALRKKPPWVGFLGRIHLKDLPLSTTKIKQDIQQGKYTNWDDPRLPTLAALMKKYKPEAFWKFSESVGLSEVDKTMDKKEFFTLLDAFNK